MQVLKNVRHLKLLASEKDLLWKTKEKYSPQNYQQLDTEFDYETQALWIYLKPRGIPCFNMMLMGEVERSYQWLEKNNGTINSHGMHYPIRYLVGASRVPNVFSYGGDLALFLGLIKLRDEEGLLMYARQCIDLLYKRITYFNTPMITISLVQGDALGGGFESVLSSQVVVAEQHARFGFPEILFNLFAGMGAYSLLASRIGSIMAETMMMSGKVYTAAELYKMGVVNVLAETGKGRQAVDDYIQRNKNRFNGLRSVLESRHCVSHISHAELMHIASTWTDAALRLKEKDLRVMAYMARSQVLAHAKNNKVAPTRNKIQTKIRTIGHENQENQYWQMLKSA